MPMAIVSLLLAGTCLVAGFYHRRDLVGRNVGVGIRTSQTMWSDRAWYAAHRAAAPYFTRAAVAPAVAGVVILVTLRQRDGLHAILFLAGLVPMAAYVLLGSRAGIEAAREQNG